MPGPREVTTAWGQGHISVLTTPWTRGHSPRARGSNSRAPSYSHARSKLSTGEDRAQSTVITLPAHPTAFGWFAVCEGAQQESNLERGCVERTREVAVGVVGKGQVKVRMRSPQDFLMGWRWRAEPQTTLPLASATGGQLPLMCTWVGVHMRVCACECFCVCAHVLQNSLYTYL